MDIDTFVKKAREFSKPFRVTKGDKFRLKDVDPGDTLDLKSEDKPRAKEALAGASRRWPNSRTCCTPRTAGPSC